ncbi:uncharacterized protein LOC107785277 isoform X1 [Nicotiana tabacum]|uniref:Uncharacterized protein LOC107785277 isoform X1 n=1 Tax=Nicotiana tabacum TaxID=4097 RepID=A0A1S3ZCH0_TOBAC|nr:uncharacterized protein LOC104117542 [Nicotiana tomentosiformis]XP_016462029.1 PREDICTED: uncharacterized protein LOC107785277 isoform X2 [Nicotiana tabacum]
MDTDSTTSSSSSNSNGVIVTAEKRRVRIENPFTLKVGQVFTGFGIGCGIGIGVGRPLNLGAIPMLNQVMTATRGATDAFSGVGRHVNNSLRKVGAKGIEAGIGCGVGFGHGFGVGLAVKRGVVDQIQLFLIQAMTKLMMKSGMSTGLSVGQGILPPSLQAGMRTINEASNQNPLGSVNSLEVKVPHNSSLGLLTDTNTSSLSSHENETSKTNVSSSNTTYSSRTEKVLSNFLQSSLLKDEGSTANELSERLRSENNLLHIVLKHQQVIDELMQENEKLRQILVKDLKVSPSKLHTSYSSGSKFPCTECFECRRKQRRR